MAGNHVGGSVALGGSTGPARLEVTTQTHQPKIDKAYMEGRLGVPAADPHPTGSPASVAWIAGDANNTAAGWEYETGIAAVA